MTDIMKGVFEMHKILKLFIAELCLLLLVIPSSHAIEQNRDESPPTQASLSYNIDFKDNLTMDKESKQVNLFAFSGIKSNRSYMIDGEEEGSKHTQYGSDVALRSYITIQDTPQSIINDITIDFSTQKSNSSFDMDFPSNINDALVIGSAFMTNLMIHEFGHAIVAEQVGASGNRVNFFTQEGGSFFLGKSSVSDIEPKSRLPYVMGGEYFVDLTFEQALKEYRKSPSLYNKSLLLFSGADFLFYCVYAFSTDSDNTSYDPVTISRETGLSKSELISIVLAKTMLNAYRVHSGVDKVIPYFTVDNQSAALNFAIPF